MLAGSSSPTVSRSVKYSGIQACTDGIHPCIAGIIAVNRQYHWGEIFNWEGDGFVLLYKRLESGFFQWPRSETEARALTPQQYRWLMEGLSIDQPKAHKPAKGLEIV